MDKNEKPDSARLPASDMPQPESPCKIAAETKSRPDIKCVIFDFAFTLCSDFYCKYTPPECPNWFYQFERHIWARHSPYTGPWLAGEMSSYDIAQVMTRHLSMSAEKIVANMEDGCRRLEFNPAVLNLARDQHRKGRRIALVTVNVDLFSRIVVPAHGLDELFDVIINSADYRTLNKDRLWPVAFEKLGSDIQYQNSLLIEDAEDRVRQFRELGGQAYQYTTDAALEEWLTNEGRDIVGGPE